MWKKQLTAAELFALKMDISDYRLVSSHYSEFKHIAYEVDEVHGTIHGIVRFLKKMHKTRVLAIFGIDIDCRPLKRESYKLRWRDMHDCIEESKNYKMFFEQGNERTKRQWHCEHGRFEFPLSRSEEASLAAIRKRWK